MRIETDGKASLNIYELKFSPEAIRQIRALAEILIGKTTYHVERLGGKMARKIPGIPGEYLMDLVSETFRSIQSPRER